MNRKKHKKGKSWILYLCEITKGDSSWLHVYLDDRKVTQEVPASKKWSKDLQVKHSTKTGVVLKGTLNADGRAGIQIEKNESEEEEEDFQLSDSD